MTCEETTFGQTIDRVLSEHPDLDPPSDGALDNLGQFHIDGPHATGLLIAASRSPRATGPGHPPGRAALPHDLRSGMRSAPVPRLRYLCARLPIMCALPRLHDRHPAECRMPNAERRIAHGVRGKPR